MRFSSSIIMIFLLIIAVSETACKKETTLNSGGTIRYSTDTVTFDTVFTSLGSFTTSFKIYNPQNQKINISSIKLENANGKGYFHINVDGYAGGANSIELMPKDSIWVFATVTIDPNDQNTPFIIEDNVITTMNGKQFKLPLVAYGQNAHYIVDSVLETQTWLTDKPYVIMHNAEVDSDATLTIPAGCHIYVHADSRLFVVGTLRAIGTKKDSIVFQGDRLDRAYFGNEGYPGEWGGLYFTPSSTNNVLDYVVLKNCGNSTKLGDAFIQPAAIQVTSDHIRSDYQLTMNHCIIENSIGYGILSFSGSIKAQNCLINTCGANNLGITQGGTYEFNNCNFVTYGTNKVSHIDNPCVIISNFFTTDNISYVIGDLNATLRNCVIWGSMDQELYTTKLSQAAYNLTLDHCLYKKNDTLAAGITLTNNIVNKDPMFVNYQNWDYHPQAGSPLIDNGVSIPALTDDLDGNPRAGVPDIGCYEFK